MKCPYCKKEMRKGIIYRGWGRLKWISEEKDRGILSGFMFIKGLYLPENHQAGIITYYCDIDEIFLIENKK